MTYIRDKYGSAHTANLVTFSKMKTKSVIKDIAKVMDVPFDEVNAFTRALPKEASNDDFFVSDIYKIKECKPFIDKYPDLFKYAEKLENTTRQTGVHAAGIVISPKDRPIDTIVPIKQGKVSAKETASGVAEVCNATQVDKTEIEHFGLR